MPKFVKKWSEQTSTFTAATSTSRAATYTFGRANDHFENLGLSKANCSKLPLPLRESGFSKVNCSKLSLAGDIAQDRYMSQPLRNAWSASTLPSGVNALNEEAFSAIKDELPDDVEQLRSLEKARSPMCGIATKL